MAKKPLRSQKSYGKLDRDGFIHRSWIKATGLPDHVFDGRPIIGIANTWSELVTCQVHLRGSRPPGRASQARLHHRTCSDASVTSTGVRLYSSARTTATWGSAGAVEPGVASNEEAAVLTVASRLALGRHFGAVRPL